jgi:alkanesulfonate monooxygenase SsuD/methylene tetrahydromethanopterin reductase-like flavin-dependent oxidoreductase (luciferase family)
MHVGFSSAFGNPGDSLPDSEVYQRDLRLFDLAEPLGFDSLWTVEHHFTGYNMSPSPLVFLSYMAGRTRRIRLGSQVVVLTWHDPLQVAEEVALLDNLSGGRFLFGMGRGLARSEYEGYRTEVETSRDRFAEYATMIMDGLETGFVEGHGQFVEQPRRQIRPTPLRGFRDRAYVASMSSEAMPLLATLGVGLKIVVQKPWPAVKADVDSYAKIFRACHGFDAPAPIVTSPVFVDENPDRASEVGQRWMSDYFRSLVEHYEFDKPYGGPGDVYQKMAANIAKYGWEEMGQRYAGLCPCGTSEEVYQHIAGIQAEIGMGGFIAQFQFARMPAADAEASMRLFAERVLPRLRDLPGGITSDGAAAEVTRTGAI